MIFGGATGKHIQTLSKIQNRILRICIFSNAHIETDRLYDICKTSKLDVRRTVHLNIFMYKQQNNALIVNKRNVNTRAHDALLFTTQKTNDEKLNVFYREALSWNSLPVIERNIPDYKKLTL